MELYKKGNVERSTMVKKPNETIKIFITVCVGIVFGFFIGVSFPSLPLTKLYFTSVLHDFAIGNKTTPDCTVNITADSTSNIQNKSSEHQIVKDMSKIWVPLNPKGAERLPPDIVVPHSDLYLRRLWGLPSEDLSSTPKYLVTFTVGYSQRNNIDAVVEKFSENFTILFFHYDGRTTEWDEFEWSKRAIHISARR